MDIHELQASLRRFAAERNWQPFHTPKNLAMALMVEAAELVEIFQWMTPEESLEAQNDPVIARHIGEEVADVLLYLLQLADHTKTDLQQAVQAKLARNAQKYPSPSRIDADATVPAQGLVTHVLLDYENVQPTDAELRALIPEASKVWVFHGPHQKQIEQRFTSYGDSMTAVPISKTGKNALDFHLSFYMGYIASRNREASIVVVANDKGYEPMMIHAAAMGFAVRRVHHRPAAATPRKVTAKAVASKNAKAPAKKQSAIKKTTGAKSPLAKTPVTKKPAAKAIATKKAAGPAAKKSAEGGTSGAPAPSDTTATVAPDAAFAVTQTLSKRAIDGLRKMGGKRPVKIASLRRALKPLLGTAASEDAITAMLNHLMPMGVITVEPSGAVSYPQFAIEGASA